MYNIYQPTIQQFLDKNCQHVYIGGNQLAIHVWRHTKAYTYLFIE